MHLPVRVGFDLVLSAGGADVALTPAQGLRLAETLARRSFRRLALDEMAAVHPLRRGTKPPARPLNRGDAR